jgi:hypothetical protein
MKLFFQIALDNPDFRLDINLKLKVLENLEAGRLVRILTALLENH